MGNSGIGSGCMDAGHFRDQASRGFLPHPKSINSKGFFGEYFFDTGVPPEVEGSEGATLRATYSFARCLNPFDGDAATEFEDYIAVGLHSPLDGKNERRNLNLVVVLDVSGSMNSPFDPQMDPQQQRRYGEGSNSSSASKTKLEIAKESLVQIIDILRPGDRFGIVTFDTRVRILQPLRTHEYLADDLSDRVMQVVPGGGTHMKRGMLAARAMLVDLLAEDLAEAAAGSSKKKLEKNDSRILFLTDACPSGGGGAHGLMGVMAAMARRYEIYTTFIGVGLDFNLDVIDAITQVKAANYFSVHSKEQFHKVLVEDFNYLVSPIAFDAKLFVESAGLEMEKVYGSSSEENVGEALIEMDSIIATAKDKRGVKGSVLLIRLKDRITSDLNPSKEITLTLRYTDREGKVFQSQTVVDFLTEIVKITQQREGKAAAAEEEEEGESVSDEAAVVVGDDDDAPITTSCYGSSGIRKAILLARYTDYLKELIEEIQNDRQIADSDAGIQQPANTAAADSTTSLSVIDLSEEKASRMRYFIKVFKAEMVAIGDSSLMREIDILDQIRYSRNLC